VRPDEACSTRDQYSRRHPWLRCASSSSSGEQRLVRQNGSRGGWELILRAEEWHRSTLFGSDLVPTRTRHQSGIPQPLRYMLAHSRHRRPASGQWPGSDLTARPSGIGWAGWSLGWRMPRPPAVPVAIARVSGRTSRRWESSFRVAGRSRSDVTLAAPRGSRSGAGRRPPSNPWPSMRSGFLCSRRAEHPAAFMARLEQAGERIIGSSSSG
jgi:hypothetical protein